MAILGEQLTDEQAMRLAIEEGARGAGWVSPNPLVGCVILDRESKLIATGYHRRAGQAHAEIEALNRIGDSSILQGAQVFVTLEPCAHFGKTPPCAETLARLPIRRVVYGLEDPNPLVSGRGAQRLRQAGKVVEGFSGLKNELSELAEIFLLNMSEKRTFVAAKVATSLDGHLALNDGQRRQISGPEANDFVQWLRGCHDAIMVGARTFAIDNPSLNIRHDKFVGKRNRVFVVDPEGKTVPLIQKSNLLKAHPAEDLVWVVKKAIVGSPVQQWEVDYEEDVGFRWGEFFGRTLREGVCSLLVEGGAHLLGSLLEQGQIQRWHQIFAPELFGGNGLAASGSFRGPRALERAAWRKLGRDFAVTGRLS